MSGSLADVRTVSCADVPMEEFEVSDGGAIGRYIRFTMKNYYGTAGGGLRFFNVIHRDHDTCDSAPLG